MTKAPDPIEELSKLKPGEIYRPVSWTHKADLEAIRDEYFYFYRKCRPANKSMWLKKWLNVVYQIEFIENLAPNEA